MKKILLILALAVFPLFAQSDTIPDRVTDSLRVELAAAQKKNQEKTVLITVMFVLSLATLALNLISTGGE